ncbi:MAG: hypothetical protein A3G41_07330 [Elusimicrobia bacterium RIFCSPLOWO2_12_FULL_59_9]|nr:MAG: hypothetical protein A3G41_07330 [Elusimicrobia bacterium RIFCSPLOWO2_12_FULL_59_9]
MRELINSERLRTFLDALGQAIRFPVRLYLVGGTSLIHFGLKEQTVDIDLSWEVDVKNQTELIEVLRNLKEKLNMSIEEASPKEFIPLPAGWRDRCLWAGRFGPVDVFHFDPYSTALSKIDRGSEVDFDDVAQLLAAGKITMEKLEQCCREIIPLMGAASLRQDPRRFQRNFAILKQRIG